MSRLVPRSLLGWILVAVAVWAGVLIVPRAVAADAPVPLDVNEAITSLLQNKIGQLLSHKNADGVVIARGSLSPNFRKVKISSPFEPIAWPAVTVSPSFTVISQPATS